MPRTVQDMIKLAESETREAIPLHLKGMREDGEPIPEPSSVDAAIVDVSTA